MPMGTKLSKKDVPEVVVKWYYRHNEIPQSVYQLLVQDRITESSADLLLDREEVKARELFVSDATDTYSINSIRGKCFVVHYKDFSKATKDFSPKKDTFFYVLTYNPETRRLMSHMGEIRVGPSYQVELPECRPQTKPRDMPEDCEDREDLVWSPGITDGNLIMYLRAARSMAAFAGMCDGGSTKDGCIAASRDETTIQAISVLHNSVYDTGRALKSLAKSPVPRGVRQKWDEDEMKRFAKGLRQYGKNFFRIRKELLPDKETADLVEFYYFWKKTSPANGTRLLRRNRRPVLRRVKDRSRRCTENNNKENDKDKIKSESLSQSSCSEEDVDSEDSDTREASGYACRHCFTTSSKDWHHGGRDRVLLCTNCRHYFKRYGYLPPLNRDEEEVPLFMFKPKVEQIGALNGDGDNKTDVADVTCPVSARSSPSSIVDGVIVRGRQSPSTASTCSNSSSGDHAGRKNKKTGPEVPQKAKSGWGRHRERARSRRALWWEEERKSRSGW
ncbi:PREDICTED: arginine-glutamic acid dipeptide repeats protein-like [Priapulus caudatus]|uniref:Arginine-glutamic acid dipeptide repeats protein-like n=1 Tax=Priapulus caudatus TaxID=37621 RepID=A0ABM1FAD8_PRICU|nr:PREDICTED: arginine-glutamic acid dipeptide repeats protein-like [Priapulus caudatus]